jgi:AcrR family transcriptional regulator
LAENKSSEKKPREESTKRQERAQRILDVAAELLQRWGYKKTTIDDIARQAGVAKGTIYLHWKTREDLFMDLILREKIREGHNIQQEMERDPDGITLYSIVKYSVLASLRNPLFGAVMLRDQDMIGDLVHKALSEDDIQQRTASFHAFLTSMRDRGLIRTDLSLEKQTYLIEAITLGFLTIDQFLPEVLQLTNEEKAELAAEAVRRTLELRQPGSDEKQITSTHYRHMIDEAQEYLEKRGKNNE